MKKLFCAKNTKIYYLLKDNSKFNLIPKNTKDIIFYDEFNDTIENLPKNIHRIQFGKKFNQDINNLPNTVALLKIDNYFSKTVNILPKNLSLFVIDRTFGQENIRNICSNVINIKEDIVICNNLCTYSYCKMLKNSPIYYLDLMYCYRHNYPIDGCNLLCIKDTHSNIVYRMHNYNSDKQI